MPDIFTELDRSGSSPNWHSGLKTLPRHEYNYSTDSSRRQQVRLVSGKNDRWDYDNEKTLTNTRSRSAPHQRFVHDDEWSSGLKVLDDSRVHSHTDHIAQIANHHDHGAVRDWEYTGTLQKTLEVEQPKAAQESWLSENYKVLPAEEARYQAPHQRESPSKPAQQLLETETIPTTEWSAGHKVVPANRRRKYLMNNQSDFHSRGEPVEKASHLPSDGTWNTESFKTLEQRRRYFLRELHDEWESGFKVVTEDDLARERRANKVHHPFTWLEESHKTLPYEKSHKPNIYRFSCENTGWDSAHFKTLDPHESAPSKYGPRASIPFALNHDWYMDHKVLPRTQRRTFVHADEEGWDSGLKTLPRTFGRRPLQPRADGGYWDLENRKTLRWEEERTATSLGEGNRHIMARRHEDMVRFHERMCRQPVTYRF